MKFTKAETNGNDFVIIENLDLDVSTITQIADRRYGVGADQVILFKKTNNASSHEVKFFNSDGSEADMCGNGLCALTKFLGGKSTFVVKGQEYTGRIKGNGITSIVMPRPKEIQSGNHCKIINVGNNHIVILLKQLKDEDMLGVTQASENEQENNTKQSHAPFWREKKRAKLAKRLVKSSNSKLAKYNVHFVDVLKDGTIQIDSYERGAGYTFACGSGAIACAFAYGDSRGENRIKQIGGESYVEFSENDKVILKTRPKIVFVGEIHVGEIHL